MLQMPNLNNITDIDPAQASFVYCYERVDMPQLSAGHNSRNQGNFITTRQHSTFAGNTQSSSMQAFSSVKKINKAKRSTPPRMCDVGGTEDLEKVGTGHAVDQLPPIQE